MVHGLPFPDRWGAASFTHICLPLFEQRAPADAVMQGVDM